MLNTLKKLLEYLLPLHLCIFSFRTDQQHHHVATLRGRVSSVVEDEVRRVCTTSHLALAHTTPVSTAFWTTPENVCFCGILKDKCQLVGTLLLLTDWLSHTDQDSVCQFGLLPLGGDGPPFARHGRTVSNKRCK